jgi:hypothetical protein
LSETITNEHAQQFNELLHELWQGDKFDRLAAAQLYLKTLGYFMPKKDKLGMNANESDSESFSIKVILPEILEDTN